MAHTLFSPSASSRWLACPASLNLGKGDDTPSEYAAEGTAAHRLAHQCLLLGTVPGNAVGKTIDGFPVTDEMAEAVQIYMDVVQAEYDAVADFESKNPLPERFALAPAPSMRTEAFLKDPFRDDFGGTVDCLILSSQCIAVVDFKYGAGVPVEVANNSQLLCYLLLALWEWERRGGECPIQNFRAVIVQPRASHPDGPVRVWDTSASEIGKFYQQVRDVQNSAPADRKYSAGDHCRWCPHKADCPELYSLTVETAREEFDPDTMTPERAAELLQREKSIRDYLSAVGKWVHSRLEKGVDVPGFKLVHAFGNRRYAFDEDEIVKRCRKLKLGKKQIFDSVLKSPAQLEKVAGTDFVSGLVERPLKGTTVVPESDKRQAVNGQTAADEFANLTD